MAKGNDINRVKKELFNSAMKGKWDEVIEIYKNHPCVHKEKITRSGQTALHIAVSDGKEGKVAALVDIIYKAPKEATASTSEAGARPAIIEALKIADDRGNTPLHMAASLGSVAMCQCIVKKGSLLDLIGIRNHDSETPLFLAALHGHKDAFLCLHYFIKRNDSKPPVYSTYYRRNDGETILHCAISGDYFDLAFQIIHLYKKLDKDLINAVNEQGVSPLHLLATKPSAFRSGSHLGRFDQIIYHCIFVEELIFKEEASGVQNSQSQQENKKPKCPENYQTCYSFIELLKKVVVVATTTGSTGKKMTAGDAENPGDSCFNNLCGNLTSNRKQTGEAKNSDGSKGHQLFPPNYATCFEIVKLASKSLLIILGLGSTRIRKIQEKKQKHTWSLQILDELLEIASKNEYENDGAKPLLLGPSLPEETTPYEIAEAGDVAFLADLEYSITRSDNNSGIQQKGKTGTNVEENIQGEKKANVPETGKTRKTPLSIEVNNGSNIVQKIVEQFPVEIHDTNVNKKVVLAVNRQENTVMSKRETPILIAAKNGITEIVQKIFDKFPVAIHDINADEKNIVLLAVENRQPHVYQLLQKLSHKTESVFRKVDGKGNSALHLAAMLGDHKPWLIPGAALQMQWELRWYEFVKDSMPLHFFVRYNKENKTPKDIFTETHSELVKAGGEWLTNTSESCSVVAALIATVAFATSSTVPGGVNSESGTPTLEDQPAFNVFAISSLVALCFSVTAVVMFLSILTSRYQEKDFGTDLPRKLLVGLTSLFVSIASMLISFCAGHFFVLKDKLKFAAFPVYAVTCLPVTFFAIAQFPLYFDLAWATFKKVPQRSYKSIPL